MQILKTLTAVGVTAAALATAGPAVAAGTAETYWSAGATEGATSVVTQDEHSFTAIASGQWVTGVDGTGTLVITCSASGLGFASTAITACYALGADGEIYRVPSTGAKPGFGDARTSAGLRVPPQPYQVCLEATGTTFDGETLTASHCTRPVGPAVVEDDDEDEGGES